MSKKLELHQVLIHFLFLVVSLAMILPLLLVVIISFSDEQSIIHHGYQFIPYRLSLAAYKYITDSSTILFKAYGVTIFITIVGTFSSLLITTMIAYVISRRDYRYNRSTTFYVFFTMLFNGGLVPFYMLITQYLHLKDTIWALILPAMLSPFYVMIMKGFLSKVPIEIIESAKLDGAREFRVFFTIVIPLSTPALATLGLFISFAYWNEWFNGLLFIDNQNLVPLQLLLIRILNSIDFLTTNPDFVQGMNIDLSQFPNNSMRMAMAVLSGGPMMFIFPFFQRYFVKGLTVGSLKG